MIGVYVHVPFCQAICSYCNFNRGLFDGPLKTRYVEAIEREILASAASVPVPRAPEARGADTIYFGGGTPSLLDPAEAGRIIAACRAAWDVTPDAEVTLETNPETVTPGRLAAFREAGVTRLSLGVQSFHDEELRRLGRVHSADRAREAVARARAEGFDNVSLDLMLWLPGQSLASWLQSVEAAIALAPEHVSLYLLELYPNAPLRETMARAPREATAGWVQASDDEAADMYLAGLERLDAAGYAQYEISNVARPDRSSRHNVKYWQGGDWRGVGCGAHSTIDGIRWRNVSSTTDYVERVFAGAPVAVDVQPLSPAARREDALVTGLRLAAGVNMLAFQARYGMDPWAEYAAALAPCVADGLMWRTDEAFGLTRRGMLVANEILMTFV